MEKLEIIRQLLCDQEFDFAYERLKKHHDDQYTSYILSLLCRMYDDYVLEKTVVEESLSQYGFDPYMVERKKWHDLDFFDKLVPRQPLILERNPAITPSPETLEKTCIVTCGDSKYLSFIIELIESIKNTQNYNKVPICIIDNGFSDQDKHYLMTRWDDLVFAPIVDNIDVPDHLNPILKIYFTKPFYNDYFKGFRYYLGIDADSWIQNEKALDQALHLCQKQGVTATGYGNGDGKGTVNEGFYNKNYAKYFAPEYHDLIFNKHAVTDGMFCIDAESGFFELWRNGILDNLKNYDAAFTTNAAEMPLTYAFHKMGARDLIPLADSYCFFLTGLPVVHGKDNVLYAPYNQEPLGQIHLVGTVKNFHFLPMRRITEPMPPEECLQSIQRASYIIHTQNIEPLEDEILTAYRYRVWPWADKSEIKEKLLEI